MSESTTSRYVLERQLSIAGLAVGWITIGLGLSALFASYGLQALVWLTTAEWFGIAGIGAALVVSLFVSKVVIGRIWGYAFVLFGSMVTFFGELFPAMVDQDPEEAETYCHDGDPVLAAQQGFFTLLFLSFFVWGSRICGGVETSSAFAYATCFQAGSGAYRTVLLYVESLMWSGFGVGGTFLGIAVLLELTFIWRGSVLRARYRSSPAYKWLHPVGSLNRDLRFDEEDDSDGGVDDEDRV